MSLRPTLRRDRLTRELISAPVAMIRAPAGYGKSVLLHDLGEALQVDGRMVRWMPAQNFSPQVDLARALAPSCKSQPDSLPEPLATIAASGAPITLLIDDLHRRPGKFRDFVRGLIDHRPDSLQIIVAGRAELDRGFARLRVNGAMVELGAEQLRFTDSETANFFQLAGIPLDPAVRGDVQRLTEGWAAALHVISPLLQQKLRSRADLAQRLARPSGTLGVYLRDEVLGDLPAEANAFLLECGTLGRFTVELAGNVTGCSNAASFIREFVRQGMFLATDEADDRWYRFHPLVSAWLETTLRREAPSRSRTVHRAAAEWHRQSGRVNDAIPHAFAAEDVDIAVQLLEQASFARGRIGRWRAFTGWTSRLPQDLLYNHPAVLIEAATAHAVLYEFESARALTETIRTRCGELSDRAQLDLIAADATIAAFADQPAAAIAASEQGLAWGECGDAYTRGTFRLSGALGWLDRGDLGKARGLLIEALATYQNGASPFGAAMTMAVLGLTHAIEGNLHQAISAWNGGEATVRPLETASAIESVAISYMPLVLYEQNRLALAESYLERCFASTAEIAMPDMVTSLYLAAARLALAGGRRDHASELLGEAEVTAARRGWRRLARAAGWERVDLALRSGLYDEARRLWRGIDDGNAASIPAGGPLAADIEGDGLPGFKLEAMLVPSRGLVTRLRGEISRALAGGRGWRVVRLMVIEALARENLGDRGGALRGVKRAVEAGARGGMIRTFIDAGPKVMALVQILAAEEARSPSAACSDIGAILAAAGAGPLVTVEEESPTEALSPREVEVLEMVAAGLSNRELAGRLLVSENTVKWHLQHIFAKLGVKNRTRAILVARQHAVIP